MISAYQRSATLEKAYLTDLFQEMTDLGTAVHCVTIERGWKEIDTVEDYEKAVKALKTLEEQSPSPARRRLLTAGRH